MGMYLNIGNAGFQSVRKGLYVDKTGLISFINSTLGTKDKLTCVSAGRGGLASPLPRKCYALITIKAVIREICFVI